MPKGMPSYVLSSVRQVGEACYQVWPPLGYKLVKAVVSREDVEVANLVFDR